MRQLGRQEVVVVVAGCVMWWGQRAAGGSKHSVLAFCESTDRGNQEGLWERCVVANVEDREQRFKQATGQGPF